MSALELSAPETSIDPILGWRVWHVERAEEGPRLVSWSRSGRWPHGSRMEASCKALRLRSCAAPRAGHGCGIYALRERDDAAELLRALGPVGPAAGRLPAAIGRVSLWGRVIENTAGWRAEFAYPYDLELVGGDGSLAAELRGAYAVDVSLS